MLTNQGLIVRFIYRLTVVYLCLWRSEDNLEKSCLSYQFVRLEPLDLLNQPQEHFKDAEHTSAQVKKWAGDTTQQ